MRFAVVAGLSLAASCLVLGAASATPPGSRRSPPQEQLPPDSRSVGYPWRGKLVRGVKLRSSQYVRYSGEYAEKGNFFGTRELVRSVERAATRVAVRLPGAKLTVGELSRPRGGDIDGHNSHESGRDIDIAFYVTSADSTVFDQDSFLNFGADGAGLAPNEQLRFDDARNWELISKLVTDPDARVQYLFVGREIQARLLDEAARRQAPRAAVQRARQVMVQPAHGHPHRNHYHVRIYCPPDDRPDCRDRPPYWAWYPGDPPARSDRIAATGAARW